VVLAYLRRPGKGDEVVALVSQCALRLYDGRKLTKQTELPTHERAIEELDKLVARRTKAGWALGHRIESPWVDWVVELERMWERIQQQATASGVTVAPGAMFQLLTPSWRPPEQADANPEFEELLRVGAVRMHVRLGDDRLMHDLYFEIGARYRADDAFWRMRRPGDHFRPSWEGRLKNNILESRLDDQTIRHASADEFRAWFPRFVRDDVLTFAIAELAR
jgi:hypothetical protein